MKVMVTGANGFVGRALCHRLGNGVDELIKVVRRTENPGEVEVGSIDGCTDWQEVLEGVDVIIHTAARVHIMNDSAADVLASNRIVNTQGTLNLANQAANAGVKRFIFISSIKVNGESTQLGSPFTEEAHKQPLEPYGQSKAEAEEGLHKLTAASRMEVVIIRPPLVYGVGVKGNFNSMLRWVKRGIPLPLGAIHNKRSMVALDNLVDLIVTCVEHPAAANQIFLAGDGQDLSITELLQHIGRVLGKPARLIPLPASLIIFIASLLGSKALAQRLCGSLQVDISKARKLLGWEPSISVEEGLRRVVKGIKK